MSPTSIREIVQIMIQICAKCSIMQMLTKELDSDYTKKSPYEVYKKQNGLLYNLNVLANTMSYRANPFNY